MRGRPDLLWAMPRAKVKGTKVRAKSNPAAEPNFWDMHWVGVAPSKENKLSTPLTTLRSAVRATVEADVEDALACLPDQVQSSTTLQQQERAQRNHSLSIVSELGDDIDNFMSDNEGKPVDFFDRLLDEMFENDQLCDIDALQLGY